MSADKPAVQYDNGVQIPEPGDIAPWHMLGYLRSRLAHKGRITKADWNRAAEAARAEHHRHDAPPTPLPGQTAIDL